MSNFAFSDLHGNLNAWRAIQAQTGPDDCLYCLGDAADRGPDGYLMLREILADPRVIYLKGNHDDMFVEWNIEDNLTRSLHWRHHCGGKPTYDAWKADGKPSDILIKLWHAPIHQMLVTEKGLILLSHAGYTPRQNCLRNLSDDDLLRGRKHFTDPWELGDRKIFVVHGHTPVELLPFEADPNKPAFYCEEHKVCIDLGTHRTNNCALLNLDDFSYKVIHV